MRQTGDMGRQGGSAGGHPWSDETVPLSPVVREFPELSRSPAEAALPGVRKDGIGENAVVTWGRGVVVGGLTRLTPKIPTAIPGEQAPPLSVGRPCDCDGLSPP